MIHLKKRLLLALLGSLSLFPIFLNEASAFSLSITNRQYSNPAFKATFDDLAGKIESQFNNSIASGSNQNEFLGATGNANAVSGRSYLSPGVIPADSKFAVSVGGSLALALGKDASLSKGVQTGSNQLPPVSVGGKTGATVGVSGRYLKLPIPLDPNRVMYMASFYSIDLSNAIGKGVTLKSTQASLGLAYQLYQSRYWLPMIQFNGLRVVSGLTYSTFDANYTTPFHLTQTDAATSTVVDWNNNVNLGVTSHVWSFTNEVTVGAKLFWFLNLYTGIGFDFNVGSSQIVGGSTGPVTGTQAGTQVFSGTAVVDGNSDTASPTFAELRYILGTEFDVGPVGIYIQGQASTPSVYAVDLGVHFVF